MSPRPEEAGPTLQRPTPARLLEGVLALGRDIHLGMDERALAERFLRAIEDLFPGRLCAIRLAEPKERLLVASQGARLRPSAERGPFILKRSAAEKTKLSPQALSSGHALLTDVPESVFEGSGGGFSVPLVAAGQLYGALDVGYPPGVDAAAMRDEDEPLVIPLANHLSVAVRNVRLHQEAAFLQGYLQKLIDHANVLILGVDRHWRITVFNLALSRLTGLSRTEVLGKDVRDWLPPAERSRLTAEIAYALGGRQGASVDVELFTKSGAPVRTVWNIAAVGSSARNVEAVVAVGQDITQLKSLERQVIQAEKLATLGQLAAGVVHELNNPLTSVIVYADYLQKKLERGVPLDGGDQEKLRRILEGAERIQNFARDLVQYAKPQSEDFALLSLNDVVRQSLSFCEHMLRRPEIELVTDLAEELAPLRGVRGQLQQVIINLLTNAVHALPARGGRLRLRTFQRSHRHVALMVEDDGSGIRPEDLGRVFEPFFTTKTDGKGTGLGLSIVRNIVERHHGSITVDSEWGRGTVFTVVLPTGR